MNIKARTQFIIVLTWPLAEKTLLLHCLESSTLLPYIHTYNGVFEDTK